MLLHTLKHAHVLYLFAPCTALLCFLLQAFVCGRAASGLSCILVRVLTKAVLPDTFGGLRTSTLSFLCVAALIVFGCVVVATCVLPTHCTNASWQLPLGTAAAASLTGGELQWRLV